MRIGLVTLLVLSGCVHKSECLEGAVERDGECVLVADAGLDAGAVDGSIDAGPPIGCDDGIACTTDREVDGGCEATPDDGACTSEVECAVGRCDAEGGCVFTYDDGMCPEMTCNTVRCDETDGCTYTPLPEVTSCDDGTFCNGADICTAGACVSPGDPCPGMSMCDEAADECDGCAGEADCPADETVFTACTYANGCATTGSRMATTTTYTCAGGTCNSNTSTTTVTTGCNRTTNGNGCADDGNDCTDDVCSGGSCTHPRLANDTPCASDANPCTRDVCQSGACAHPVLADSTGCPGGYCCSAACVSRGSNNHCGVCGMNCAAFGQTCTNAISNNGPRHNLPGAFVCTCVGNQVCKDIGYGIDGTCFGGHCQCQCAAASPTSCGGQCSAGTCFEDTIEPASDNFCGY